MSDLGSFLKELEAAGEFPCAGKFKPCLIENKQVAELS